MLIKIGFVNLFMLIVWSATSQDRHDKGSILANSVDSVDAYVFRTENAKDSMLITREFFISNGLRNKIEVYDSIGLSCTYSYKFDFDTILVERTTVCDSNWSISKYYYDKQNRIIKEEDFDENGLRTGVYATTKYKKHSKETKGYMNNKLSVRSSVQYDKSGNKIDHNLMFYRNGVWKSVIKDKNGEESKSTNQIFENYHNSGLKLKRVTQQISAPSSILGLCGIVHLKKGDTFVTNKFYDAGGLLVKEMQYLNVELLCIKRYYYHKSEKNLN